MKNTESLQRKMLVTSLLIDAACTTVLLVFSRFLSSEMATIIVHISIVSSVSLGAAILLANLFELLCTKGREDDAKTN